ncbi:flagellar hook-length control protein FliK [Pseudomonas sp. SJZ079]|uniref:flagellar hook-length control protein FliK n=1 Tax=Pseudomonas sp. SJZ079 TaxID=2572887 RepID=UPI0011993A17|nr:flagellar hook-length control protein FliK [Pseudomonas sp. SJZ079]TWC42959.1 flagellar hook-length control protein FliK [Pseudomonas sp. SJZ079]
MSVAPDVLLKSAPDIKPKNSAGKTPAKAPEPSKSEASSFAQVYAKERQASAAPAKPSREATSEAQDAEESANPSIVAAAEQSVLADSGKSLPSDPALEDPALDELLLMGMAGQPVPNAEIAEPVVGEDGEVQVLSSVSLISSGPASMTEASVEPELEALNQLPAVRMALELGGKAQTMTAEQGAAKAPDVMAQQAALNPVQSFSSAMASMGAQQSLSESSDGGDVPLIELTTEGLEALKESAADSRPENFVSKLSALSQAVAQSTAPAPRAAVIPGQPVAMQQAGWSEAVVDRVMWLSSQNLQSAEIQLDPAELGRMEVRISLSQEQAQVTFASPHAGVREALEGQMHRLRELFTQQGMNLLDVNVSDQSSSRGWQGQDGGGRGRDGGGSESLGMGDDELALSPVELRSNSLNSGRGMVDYYA